jgi:hypothetical protein
MMADARRAVVRCLQAFAGLLLSMSLLAQDDPTIVRGRAIDRDGKPVAHCAVGVLASDNAFFESAAETLDTKALLASPLATTDAEGRYDLRVPRDDFLVIVVATKQHQVCVLRPSSGPVDVIEVPTALMLPGTSVRGRVRDAAGRPIPGACVHVEDPLLDDKSVRPRCCFESTAHSDEHGMFEVIGVPRTGLRVVVTALGFASEARLASHESPLDFTLTATGVVRGRVADADGRPLADCVVRTVAAETRVAKESVISDGEGRFAISAPLASRFRVIAREGPVWYESFSTGLLHGPATDVALIRPTPAGALRVTLRCVDAATKAPIPEYRVSRSQWLTQPLLEHLRTRRLHRGEATFDVVPPDPYAHAVFVVDAPGHATVTVPIPDAKGPLVVELPAECCLAGRVLDAETGKPAAGAAVCALPSPGIFYGDSSARLSGVLTGTDGRYRIGGLAAGNYDVRVYAAGRPVPPSRSVVVAKESVNELDLEVPKARFLDVELAGEVPGDCLGEITWTTPDESTGSIRAFFVPMPAPRNVPLPGPRTRRIGPVGNDALGAWLYVPMRNRVDSVVHFIGNLAGDSPRLPLPELRRFLHRGRVELPSDVPPERVAVIARRTDQQDAEDPDSFAACLAVDGTFELDLPPARYALQLVDLETFLVFHTEAADRTFDENTVAKAIAITPEIHWLTIAMKPTIEGAAIVDQGVTFELPSPRDKLPALFDCSFPQEQYEKNWTPRSSTRGRLLVPPGRLTLQASQAFAMLNPRSEYGQWQPQQVARAEIEVTAREHEVTLRLPPPPSDDEIDKLVPAAGRH